MPVELFTSCFELYISNEAFGSYNSHLLVYTCMFVYRAGAKVWYRLWLQGRDKNCPEGQHAEEASSSSTGCFFNYFLFSVFWIPFLVRILYDFFYFFITLFNFINPCYKYIVWVNCSIVRKTLLTSVWEHNRLLTCMYLLPSLCPGYIFCYFWVLNWFSKTFFNWFFYLEV